MVDRKRLTEELRRMRTLINDDPKVRARFDRDGNGVIDGDEWEEVRQLVIRRLEREETEANEASVEPPPGPQDAPDEAPTAPAAIAEEIYAHDLTPRAPPSGPVTSLSELDELVLKREGGVGAQVFETLTRRQYSIVDRWGTPVGAVQQQEIEAAQNFTRRPGFEIPDLHFVLLDTPAQTTLTLRRTAAALSPTRMDVLGKMDLCLASCRWQLKLLGTWFAIESPPHPHGIQVKRRSWRSLTFDILDAFDEPIGVIQRSWVGLGGFLSGGNQTHVRVDASKTTPGLRLGLVAAMLLIDSTPGR